ILMTLDALALGHPPEAEMDLPGHAQKSVSGDFTLIPIFAVGNDGDWGKSRGGNWHRCRRHDGTANSGHSGKSARIGSALGRECGGIGFEGLPDHCETIAN